MSWNRLFLCIWLAFLCIPLGLRLHPSSLSCHTVVSLIWPNLLLILLTLFFLLFYVLSEIHSSFHFIGPYICGPLSNSTSLNVIFCIKSPYISEYILYIKRYRVIKVQSFVGFQRWTLSHSLHLFSSYEIIDQSKLQIAVVWWFCRNWNHTKSIMIKGWCEIRLEFFLFISH